MKTLDRPAWLPQSIFPFQSRFVAIDGKQIHYIDEGSGPALLFVSAGRWSFMFRDVILRLRAQFRCLTLDFPGSGLSPDVEDYDQSVRVNAWILDGFIDALDLQDTTMVVHDVGGPIGFLIATMRPERFRALVTQQHLRLAARRVPTCSTRGLAVGEPAHQLAEHEHEFPRAPHGQLPWGRPAPEQSRPKGLPPPMEISWGPSGNAASAG